MIVSMAATTRIEAIGEETERWLQLYLQPDGDFTTALVQRAEKAGYGALVVTVDSPVLGRGNATTATVSTISRRA